MKQKGFTLIELLIVVAIIAILAAIAVPNFLEAQTRSKVSRVRADVRTVVTALEAYAVDWNKYPVDLALVPLTHPTFGKVTSESFIPPRISTPIAYLTTAQLPDPFVRTGAVTSSPNPIYFTIFYQNVDSSIAAADSSTPVPREYLAQDPPVNAPALKSAAGWGIGSPPGAVWKEAYGSYKVGSLGPDRDYTGGANIYDATNGTVSAGDIYRTQKKAEGGGV